MRGAFNFLSPGFVGAAGGALSIPVDVYISLDGTPEDLITNASLSAGTTKRHPIGVQNADPEALVYMRYSSETPLPLLAKIRVGATEFAKGALSTGTYTPLEEDLNAGSYEFTTGPARASCGVYMKKDSLAFQAADLVRFRAFDGSSFICNCSGNNLRAHGTVSGGGSGFGDDIAIDPSKVHYISMLGQTGGTCTLRVWEVNAGVLTHVGDSVLEQGGAGGWQRFQWGRTDATGDGEAGADVRHAHLLIDYTYAAFPLGIAYDPSAYPVPETELDVSDDFAGTGGISADWTEALAGFARSSGALVSDEQTPGSMAFRSAESFGPAQYSRAIMTTWAGGRNIGVIVRASGVAGDRSCYAFTPRAAVGRPIQKIIDGVTESVGSNIADPGWASGDEIELRVDGTLLMVFRNGSIVGYVWDNFTAPLTAGAPGVYGWKESWGSAISYDSWEGGNLL